MTFAFRPAKDFTDRHGLFVSLTGGTNSGKTFSALRLARGIAGHNGKVAVLDTEGGRTLHLKDDFDFDASLMDPPFRPHFFSEAAKAAEDANYDAFLIDSFSMEWVGIGGVLDWQEQELNAMVERAKQREDRRSEYQIREAGKMAAWIKPKGEHKAMVYSLLQRRIPIIFAIRGEETVKPGEGKGDKPIKLFKSICSATFPFEVTVSFRLDSERKGYIDLSDPKSWKMEDAHRAMFQDGDRISEEHGAKLAAWARGETGRTPPSEPTANQFAGLHEKATEQAALGTEAYRAFFTGLNKAARDHLLPQHEALKAVAAGVDSEKTASSTESGKIGFGAEDEPDPLDAANIAELRAEVEHYSVTILRKCVPDAATGKSAYPAYEAALALISEAGQEAIRAYAAQRLDEVRMSG